MIPSQVFNVPISIRAYLHQALAQYTIPAFTSWPESPGDQQAMLDAPAYFLAHIAPGETNWIQPTFLSCAFVCTPEFSPDGYWLQTMTQLFITSALVYENPTTANLIPLYDLDAEIGEAAMLEFFRTGVLPVRLLTLLEQPPETWPLYRPDGQAVGLRFRTPTRGPEFEMGGALLRARFSLTVEYFEPRHLRGQDG